MFKINCLCCPRKQTRLESKLIHTKDTIQFNSAQRPIFGVNQFTFKLLCFLSQHRQFLLEFLEYKFQANIAKPCFVGNYGGKFKFLKTYKMGAHGITYIYYLHLITEWESPGVWVRICVRHHGFADQMTGEGGEPPDCDGVGPGSGPGDPLLGGARPIQWERDIKTLVIFLLFPGFKKMGN